MTVDIVNCQATAAVNQYVGGLPIIHAYIMGFQWNPAKSTTQFLAVSVKKGSTVN
jgi:hypothetical protein